MKILTSFAVVAALSGTAFAGELMVSTKGDTLLEDALSKLNKPWSAAKGEWIPCDSGIKGSERAADKHGAVIRRPLAFKDAVIEFSFRLDGAKGISLSINDAKGHLCRLGISKDSFQARKDDSDHEGPDKGLAFPAVKLPLGDGRWHTAVVELVGEQMVCSIDGKVSRGSHAVIAGPKANLGLTVAGQSACFKDLKVWAAAPKG
jgi:hypothetical protein